MDAVYRGLASPRQAIPIGRPDIEGADRPGAALSGLAREALEEGAFPAAAEPAPAGPQAAQARHMDHGPGDDAGHGHDLDPENEGHGPEDGDPGLDEAYLDEGMDT